MGSKPSRKPSFEEAVRQAKVDRENWLRNPHTPASNYARYLDHVPDKIPGLIEPSREGSLEWDTLSLVAQVLLRNGDKLPDELASWVADVLEDTARSKAEEKRRPRPIPRGRPRANWWRDHAIAYIVYGLVRQGFKATRNKPIKKPCPEGCSACDVVGVAFGFKKYRTVATVWDQRDKTFYD